MQGMNMGDMVNYGAMRAGNFMNNRMSQMMPPEFAQQPFNNLGQAGMDYMQSRFGGGQQQQPQQPQAPQRPAGMAIQPFRGRGQMMARGGHLSRADLNNFDELMSIAQGYMPAMG
jgi:hypothetical protein